MGRSSIRLPREAAPTAPRSNRRFTLLTILMMSAACQDAPTAPVRIDQPAVTTAETSHERHFPPLTGPGRIYAFSASLWGWGADGEAMDYTRQSRYVLYDDGSFALQMWIEGWGAGEYRGEYREEADGQIDFTWEAWSRAGAWGAAGTLRGDTLSVRYNLVMMMTDFEDAAYVLERR